MMKSLLKFFGIVAILFASAQFASGITVKVEKPADWTTVYVYSWGDAGEVFGAWPGQELTEAEGWYPAVLDETVMAANIIFNNNDTLQTENQYVTEDLCFHPTGELNAGGEVILEIVPCAAVGFTVKITKPEGWEAVYVYSWGDAGEVFGAWPGQELTEAEGWYAAMLDETITAANIIFNNNDAAQTENQLVSADMCYEWTGELNATGELILESIPCNGVGIKVGFQKPANWTEVYIYGYVNDAPVFGAWPGVMLTEDNDWYYYTMDAALTEVNVIYNNNDGEQTADVLVTEDICYQAQEDLSMLEVECGSSAIGDIFANDNQVAFYPNPANDILNIRFVEEFQTVSINSITGAKVLEFNNQAEMSSINISSLNAGVYFISFTLLDGNKVTGKLIKN